MLYVIIGHDVEHSLELRRAARPAHLERLKALVEAGRVLVAGPMPAIDSPDPGPAGFAGTVVIAEFGSLAEARAWAEDDPYYREGVFRALEVRPFNKVLP
jgi:uncharacterized protein YciI